MIDSAFDVLAVSAHPDDVELACGATLAQLTAAGKRVAMVQLTRGEAGTRGTPEERRVEAHAAAEALGVETLEILDCGDAGLRTGRAEEDALIAVIRRLRPSLVLMPPPQERHPDHVRAHHLVREACFYAGLAGRSVDSGDDESQLTAPAHRPGAMLCYMQHDLFEPSLIVPVDSAAWERKLEALACYRSQLFQEGGERDEPATKVASREFREAIEGRARHFGQVVGAELGEPFLALRPLAIADPLSLVPSGWS